eukprot:scpid62008/ scgid14636/ Zinc transporter ZIP3; Solute carrier family 39 member 3; Zrt- and Irt-like protein 3
MNIVIAKVLSILGLFFPTLLFTVLPIRLTSWSTSGGRWRRASISLASCLSGGIFLGVALLHLIPDVREMFDYVLCKKDLEIHYPLTELTVAGGFLLILVFEQLVLLFHQRRPTSECHIANVPPHGCDRERNCDNCRGEDEQDSQPATLSSACALPAYSSIDPPSDAQDTSAAASVRKDQSLNSTNGQVNYSNELSPYDPASRTNGEDQEVIFTSSTNGAKNSGLRRSSSASTSEDNPAGKDSAEALGSLVLLAALSLHSLFEGLALGLQNASDSVIELFVAILLHKCVLAFALGIRMVKLKANWKRILLAALIFSAMSPVGVAIGIAVEAHATNEVDRQLVTACLQGIATGTFLFVVFLEIISPEIQGQRSPGESHIHVMRLALIVFGFAIIALVSLQHEPHHGDDADCGHGHGHNLNHTGHMENGTMAPLTTVH